MNKGHLSIKDYSRSVSSTIQRFYCRVHTMQHYVYYKYGNLYSKPNHSLVEDVILGVQLIHKSLWYSPARRGKMTKC